jgi:hypothetical protein
MAIEQLDLDLDDKPIVVEELRVGGGDVPGVQMCTCT